MPDFSRYLKAQISRDLRQKMAFIGGPRQVGKTTLALQFLPGQQGYLNWDVPADRQKILRNEWPSSPVLALDEIHKYKSWRNTIKGLYDQRRGRQRILVTGSARLDYYRYTGDSLQGRYHYLRLHPLSFRELRMRSAEDVRTLLRLGGFPEPFFRGSEAQAKRWSREYQSHLIGQDIRDLERVQDVGNMELLLLRLPELVGAPLSINALREDLQLNHQTVARWLQIFERIYAVFRLSPFGFPKIRAVKKEQKHYHFDWTVVAQASLRFENLVAAHLLKWAHFHCDAQGRNIELRYFRDIDSREVDFVLTEDRAPVALIECKWDDEPIGKGLRYLKARFPQTPAWQVSCVGRKDYISSEGIRVCPAHIYLHELL